MQRWSEVSNAASVAVCQQSLAELARSSSIAKAAAEELVSKLTAVSEDEVLAEIPADSKLVEQSDYTDSAANSAKDEICDQSLGHVRQPTILQFSSRLMSQLRNQLQECERNQEELSEGLAACSSRVDSIQKRMDAKLHDMEQILHGHSAKLDGIQSLECENATLCAIDDRLSGLCSRLEDAAPVFSRPLTEDAPNVFPSKALQPLDSCPTLDQWGQQVTFLRQELQEAVDEVSANIHCCEQRCECLERSNAQSASAMLAEELRSLKDSVQKLGSDQSNQQHELKEQIESLAKESMAKHREMNILIDEVDSRVKGSLNQMAIDYGALRVSLHGMLTDLELKIRNEHRALLDKERQTLDLVHTPLMAQLTELQRNEIPASPAAPQDLTKWKEDILVELSSQFKQVSDIITRERQDREADMESALRTAVAAICASSSLSTSGDQSSVVSEDGKDAIVKAALDKFASSPHSPIYSPSTNSTVAPGEADAVVVCTVADQQDGVEFIVSPRIAESPRIVDTSPKVIVKAPVVLSPRGLCRSTRHTMPAHQAPSMINVHQRPGLTQQTPQRFRRSLSPSSIQRCAMQSGTATFQTSHSQSRLIQVPSSPTLHVRPLAG